jgi:hypothetical protein
MMPLEEIMRREKFNDVEKALVNHPTLSQAERIKIISEIKIAKSNRKHAAAANNFSYILILTTLVGTLGSHATRLDLPTLAVVLLLLALSCWNVLQYTKY